MDTERTTEKENPIDKISSIWCSLNVAILVQCDFEAIVRIFVSENGHIRQDIQSAGSIDIHCLILLHEISCLCFDDPPETRVQQEQHLIFLLIFKGKIVLLVHLMVALYRFLEMFVVWMIFIDFAGIVPENKVILQRSLERFAHQILKGDDPVLSRQFLLYQSRPAVLGQQLLQFPLRLVEIFEIVRIDEQKLRKADHRLPDHRLSAIPLLKFFL